MSRAAGGQHKRPGNCHETRQRSSRRPARQRGAVWARHRRSHASALLSQCCPRLAAAGAAAPRQPAPSRTAPSHLRQQSMALPLPAAASQHRRHQRAERVHDQQLQRRPRRCWRWRPIGRCRCRVIVHRRRRCCRCRCRFALLLLLLWLLLHGCDRLQNSCLQLPQQQEQGVQAVDAVDLYAAQRALGVLQTRHWGDVIGTCQRSVGAPWCDRGNAPSRPGHVRRTWTSDPTSPSPAPCLRQHTCASTDPTRSAPQPAQHTPGDPGPAWPGLSPPAGQASPHSGPPASGAPCPRQRSCRCPPRPPARCGRMPGACRLSAESLGEDERGYSKYH